MDNLDVEDKHYDRKLYDMQDRLDKRRGFLDLINDCMIGMIDIVLTKSISRFSRNLVDTLQYVRLLKERGIAIVFEKENINTLAMESEMALALLSTLAQNEIESLSANVKLGVKMKMKRGELMGFNGCFLLLPSSYLACMEKLFG